MQTSRPRLGDTRNLPDHYAHVAFKCFNDICDEFRRMTEPGHLHTQGDSWRSLLYIRTCGKEFEHFVDLYVKKTDHDPTIVAELVRHHQILLEIGLIS